MMVSAEGPLVHCSCSVVFRHHKKWATASITSSEGLHSATTLPESRVNCSLLPSDSLFVNSFIPGMQGEREGKKERVGERERYLELGHFQLFPLYICRAPLPGSRHQLPIPNHSRRGRSKWLRRAKFLTRCVETKQQLNLEIRRQ